MIPQLYSDEISQELTEGMFGFLYLACLVWLILLCSINPDLLPRTVVLFLVLLGGLALGHMLLQRSPLWAGIFWTVLLVLALPLAAFALQDPRPLYLSVIVALISGLAVGKWGLPAAGLAVCIYPWVETRLLGFSPSAVALDIFLPAALLFSGLGIYLHHIERDKNRTLVEQYFSARQALETARDDQLTLRQVEEDLVLANRELARMTEKLTAITQMAESALRTKEEFVANVSHELRTPLNMIIGFSETITSKPYLYGVRLPSRLLEDVAIIQRNSQHLASLVNDVLDLSQVDAGRMAIVRRWTDLNKIATEAMDQIRPLFLSKGLELDCALLTGSPQVFCDETRIREVILNLLNNAARFTEAGSVHLTLRFPGDAYLISVTDTGPGIPEKELEAIFEPFHQLDNSIRRKYGGTGLGLTICRRFVEMHGGAMWAESRPGEGATFTFSLPLNSSNAEPAAGPQRWINPYMEYPVRDRRFKAPVPVAVPRYVICEGREALARIFRRYMDGCEIVSVHSLPEAERELKHSPSRAFIINASDLNEEQVHQLAQIVPLGTLVLSCFMPSMQDYARQLGAMDYLIKPVTGEQLRNTLDQQNKAVEQVLLVDDQPDIIQLFSRMISESGRPYTLRSASNGIAALEAVHANRPDLIFLDLLMPEMDGFSVMQALQGDESTRDIPVIVLSSRDPTGSPALTNALKVVKIDGFTVLDLVASVRLLSDLLILHEPPGDPTPPVKPPG